MDILSAHKYIALVIFFSFLVEFFGKLHPVVVHFPIACIVLAGICEAFEILSPFFKNIYSFKRDSSERSSLTQNFLIIGTLSGIIAVLFGFANSSTTQFYGQTVDTLFFHKMYGLAALFFSLLALLFARCELLNKIFYFRASLFLSVIFLSIGSHKGALLVHGADYFSGFTDLFQTEKTSEVQQLLNKSSV